MQIHGCGSQEIYKLWIDKTNEMADTIIVCG